MSIPRFSVNNHVLVNMLMAVILIAGLMFALTMTREMFPESRPDRISITAIYPGVQPDELEKAVTIKIEEAVREVDGIEKIESTVNEGFSSTNLTLYSDIDDIDTVLQEVKIEVDGIEDLPDDMEPITVRKAEAKLPVIGVAIFGDADEALLKRAAREMRDDLLQLPEITDVEISGIRDDEISVEIEPERLLEYGITFQQVADVIRLTNVDVSGGELKGTRSNISVKTLGEEYRGEDLADIIVRTMPDGRKIYLADVATIHDGFADTDQETYFNSRRAVNCFVYKTSSQDAIQIASVVKAYVNGKQREPFDPHGWDAAYAAPWYLRPFKLIGSAASKVVTRISGAPDPEFYYEQSLKNPFNHQLQVRMHTDLSRFIEGRLDLMTRNGRSGLVLVLISLMMFLNWRVAFWAAVGLPVSFLGTFIVMWMFGVTFNLLSMFGLIIVLGIIVDDAIVIGENIFRHLEEGKPARQAAIEGAEEVMWPVTIAVTTTIAAFTPLLFIEGQIGVFMGQLPIVVLAALSVSLVEALLILPAHLSNLPAGKIRRQLARDGAEGAVPDKSGWISRLRRWESGWLHDVLGTMYERFLRTSLHWRYVTMTVATAIFLVAAGLVAGGVVRWEFIQKMDSETLTGVIEMPVGTTVDRLRERMDVLSEATTALPEVNNVQMSVAQVSQIGAAGATGGSSQSNLGQLIIELMSAEERELKGMRSSEEILIDLRDVSEKLPGVNSVVWEALSGGPGGRDIEIRVTGPRFNDVVAAAGELKNIIAGYAGVVDLDDDFDRGKRELQLRLKATARPTGLTVGQLGDHVRSAVYGKEARRITRNREDVKIMVRYPEDYRTNVFNIESMRIPTGTGDTLDWIPLDEVATITETEGVTSINRFQQNRSIKVYGDVEQGFSSTQIVGLAQESFARDVQPKYPGVSVELLGKAEEQAKSLGSLKIAFPVALLMIFTLLAGLFRSYVQPLIVMAAIPFGFVGATIGHLITDEPMTILSGIGLVALTGIVVNDSLVLVDFINSRVRAGMDPFEANIEGAKLRLRAILLTTLTTVAGLTPLMFEQSFQAKFLIPMAVTLTFGLAFATLLTLIIVPTLNMIYFDYVAVHDTWLPPASDDLPQTTSAEPVGARLG